MWIGSERCITGVGALGRSLLTSGHGLPESRVLRRMALFLALAVVTDYDVYHSVKHVVPRCAKWHEIGNLALEKFVGALMRRVKS